MISREKVMQALKDSQSFKSIFKDVLDLYYVSVNYSDQVDVLISYIFLHTEEFDRIVKNKADLIYLALNFPRFSDAIIRFVMCHPDEFNRLIPSKFDLDVCAKHSLFSKYASIFKHPSLTDARKAVVEISAIVNSNHDILQAARYLSLGHLDDQSILYNFPLELIIKFATYTRDSSVHSDAYANKLAREHYGRPDIKK